MSLRSHDWAISGKPFRWLITPSSLEPKFGVRFYNYIATNYQDIPKVNAFAPLLGNSSTNPTLIAKPAKLNIYAQEQPNNYLP